MSQRATARGDLTHVEVADLITKPEIADMLGVTREQVSVWGARTYLKFPEPLVTLRTGKLFSRREVEAWARSTGRLS